MLKGVTLTVDVDECGWAEACDLAGVASRPECVLAGAEVIAVVKRASQQQVEALVRAGFDEVREKEQKAPTRTRG